jgi:Family of unknown function (DUF6353)
MNTALMRIVKKSEVVLRQNAPTILTSVGVAGFIATTAFTIRATAKAMDTLPNIKKRIQEAKETEGDEKEQSQELAKVYLSSSVVLAKTYAPTIALGTGSILCVLAGHGMMLRRQATLVAVYTALDTSYRAYRGRVAERIGEEEEINLYRGSKLIEIVSDDDESEPACIIDMSDENPSPYAKFFDESNSNWTKTPEFNKFFLIQTERWANDQLDAYGYLFLNDVYKALKMERTQAGQIVGWKKDSEIGDGFVSFGIHDLWDENKRAFVNGLEASILLDFNVDGIIKI